jgi:hypothetical protein
MDKLVQSKSKGTYGFWPALALSAPVLSAPVLSTPGLSNIPLPPSAPLFLPAHSIALPAPLSILLSGLNPLENPSRFASQSKHKLFSFNSMGQVLPKKQKKTKSPSSLLLDELCGLISEVAIVMCPPLPPVLLDPGLSRSQVKAQAMSCFNEYVKRCKEHGENWDKEDAYRLYDYLGHNEEEARFFVQMIENSDNYVGPWCHHCMRWHLDMEVEFVRGICPP